MSLNNEFDPIGGDGVPASLDAVPQEASPRIIITAQPIQWEAHPSGQQWTENRYGYCITLESEDLPETPYVATLGEGDPETFATLAEAQAWCQRDIDATVARWAVVAAPKAEAPAAPAEVGEAVTLRQALIALEKASEFIRNGVALGYIRMPDADCPDSAHGTPPMIDAAIKGLRAALSAPAERADETKRGEGR